MHKLLATFTVLYFICLTASMMLEGSGGLNVTRLNGNLTANNATVTVDSTSGFLTADYIIIGDEKVTYTNKNNTQFLNCTRGDDGTSGIAHADNSKVYSAEGSFFNYLLGFNIVTVAKSYGYFGAVTIPVKIVTTTLPRLAFFNWSWAEGGMVWIQYVFQAIGAAMILAIALTIWGGAV